MNATYASKKEAIAAANSLRAKGLKVRVMQHSGIYTQPFKGIVSFCHYEIEVI